MKRKISKKELIICQQMDKYESTCYRNKTSIIYQCFQSLAQDLEKEYLKSDNLLDKILNYVDEKFKSQFSKALTKLQTISVNEFINYFKKNFNRNFNNFDSFGESIKKKFKIFNKNSIKSNLNMLKKFISSTFKTEKENPVKKIVSELKGSFGKIKSKIITKIETSRIFSEVNYTSAKENNLKKKSWIHLGGGKTNRASHLAIHGVTISIDEYFEVGAEGKTPSVKMRFPKDPECKEIGHTIHCHCQILYL